MSDMETAALFAQSSPGHSRNASTATKSPFRKRGRNPKFAKINVYVDTDVNNNMPTPPLEKHKTSSRTPLSVRVDSTNTSAAPPPLAPDTPFLYSPADPLWCDKENYDRHLCYTTPPSTPGGLLHEQSPFSIPSPAPFLVPSSSSHYSTRSTFRSRPAAATASATAPKDVTLYNLLGLDDYKVSNRDIRAAYRKTAMYQHPDRVGQEERCAATLRMQRVNAAKDVLLDPKRRKVYHKTGKLPWAV